MNEVPVLYGTSEGHTRRIAERISELLRERGLASAALDVGSPEAAGLDWRGVKGVVLGASLHMGKYQKEALRFAREHRDAMSARPSAFFGVSLAAASRNPREVEDARRIAESFADQTGWRPDRTESFAGALAYSRYGFLTRLLMKRIARKEGGPTDTSRDHDLTDWTAVSRFANELADALLKEAEVPRTAAERR